MTDAWIFLGLAALGAGIAFAGWMLGNSIRYAAHETTNTALTATWELVRASRHARKSHVFASQRIIDTLAAQFRVLMHEAHGARKDLYDLARSSAQGNIQSATSLGRELGSSLEIAANDIADGLRAQAKATKFDARVRSGIIHRKVRVAEKSAEEKLVDQFMSEGGTKLNDDEKLELEWALGRLLGADPEQGSISRALSVLEKFKCPRPPDITDEMIAHLLETEDFGA